MKIKQGILIFISFFVSIKAATAQCVGWKPIQTLDSIFSNPAFGNATTPEADRLHRPYIYLAMVSGGVKIYRNNANGMPDIVATIPKTTLGNLDAINLLQDSIWLYVCLGNIWNSSSQMAGLAIVDVSNPLSPSVLDVYIHAGMGGGAGSVAIKGNYAYLAANQNGLVILDIGNKSSIRLASVLPLNNTFPHTNAGSSTLYNARGIALNGDYAYICYDRGGLRVIDVSDANAPVQVNQYCFGPLVEKTTAYNNIVISNNLAYVAIDYYGMEILDIANPEHLVQKGWWHPNTWADATNDYNTWATSKGHTNEITYDAVCKKVYVASGKTDVVAIDVGNPSMPTTCETYGAAADAYGTWGLDLFDEKLYLAYIWSPVFPPYSNYTGYKVLQLNCSTVNTKDDDDLDNNISIFPNPTFNDIYIILKNKASRNIKIFNAMGVLLRENITNSFSLEHFERGVYFVVIQTNRTTSVHKIIKQ